MLTAGYDGLEFTLHANPDYNQIFGDEDTEYETVPSFIAPPQFLASIVTSIVCSPELGDEEEKYTTRDMKTVIREMFDNKTQYTPHAYAQRLSQEVEGDEGEYTIELKELAEELEDTIDSDTAESMLEAALRRARGDSV